MNDFKLGDQARLVQPEIKGEVKDIRFNKDHHELEYLLAYTAGGEDHTRWFLKSQLESISTLEGSSDVH